jgi:hypothetical protein
LCQPKSDEWSEPTGSGVGIVLTLMSMAVVFALFLVVGTRGRLRRFVAARVVEIPSASLSAELRENTSAMETLGFAVDGPGLLLDAEHPTRWQPFIWSDRRCMAALSERGSSFSMRFWDFDTLLSDGRWLMTLNDPAALSLPSHPGFLFKVLPGTSIPELFQHHQEAIRALEASGFVVQPIADNYKTATQKLVCAPYQHATMTTAASMLWRGITKRSPHAGALVSRGLQATK